MPPTVQYHHTVVTVFFDHFDESGNRITCAPLTNQDGQPFTVYSTDLTTAINIPALQSQLNAELARKAAESTPDTPATETNGSSESPPTLTPLP